MATRLIPLLLLSLTTVTFAASAPAEPNDTTPELSFQMSSDPVSWTVMTQVQRTYVNYDNPGSIWPKYAAKIVLPRNRQETETDAIMRLVMKSSLAQGLSQAQKDFMEEGFSIRFDTGMKNVANHYATYLYAVSEEDAKIMVRALMDGFAIQGKEDFAEDLRHWDEWKQGHERNVRKLAEKQERLKEIEPQYYQYKKTLHSGLSDDDAEKLAKELIFQMNKEANLLNVELAGIRAKLEILDEYLSANRPTKYKYSLNGQGIAALEAMQVNQMIELGGLEARREAIEKILTAEQAFCNLYSERREVRRMIPQLAKYAEEGKRTLEKLPETLKQRREAHSAPRVYRNTVTLYPIAGADSHN